VQHRHGGDAQQLSSGLVDRYRARRCGEQFGSHAVGVDEVHGRVDEVVSGVAGRWRVGEHVEEARCRSVVVGRWRVDPTDGPIRVAGEVAGEGAA
jgi:hypothetical protein